MPVATNHQMQSTLPGVRSSFCSHEWLTAANAEERGAVLTRPEVAAFILDLVGYTPDHPLHRFRLLEPSFGHGDFLLEAVKRLLSAYSQHTSPCTRSAGELTKAICAVEVHKMSSIRVKNDLLNLLTAFGFANDEAQRLIASWVIENDFLLTDLPHSFTHVVGNPPYVRQELIPDALMAEYRSRYFTIYDRADLYIPFIERSLRSLDECGIAGIICSDRWMKNKYGGPLRRMIAKDFHLACYIDMVGTAAFRSDVMAYPAITVMKRGKAGPTRIAHRPSITKKVLSELASALRADPIPAGSGVTELVEVTRDREPWILQPFSQSAIVRHLEQDFPSIESVGCKVGIGVATGADKVFIGPFDSLDVEQSCKLRLATTKDIFNGEMRWTGLGVINPFEDSGALVNLTLYPKLRRYLEANKTIISGRHCAQKNPKGWYRTIDRIYPQLSVQPKLLIPDIKGEPCVIYEDGKLYPHHNLYFITSNEWDLHALQAVLRSEITKLFISAYSTLMHGGFLRFQAQYLRRIRLPRWNDVPQNVRYALIEAAKAGDTAACNQATFDLYQLRPEERATVSGNDREKMK